jgi:hypothetical protein
MWFPLSLVKIQRPPRQLENIVRLPASHHIWTKPPLLFDQSNARKTSCFLTADWPKILSFSAVQTLNMSEPVMTNQATNNVASHVPIQPGASVNLIAGGTNAITTPPIGHNTIMADAMDLLH